MNDKTNNKMSVAEIVGTVIFYILAFPFIIVFIALAAVVLILCLIAELVALPITGIVNAIKSKKKKNDDTIITPDKLEISVDDYIEVEDNN